MHRHLFLFDIVNASLEYFWTERVVPIPLIWHGAVARLLLRGDTVVPVKREGSADLEIAWTAVPQPVVCLR